jgi:sugar-specific transcriptional regulator TrmB
MELITTKEKRVLAALYKLGDSPISKVAKETLINRTALYYTIDELIKKGLVSKIIRDSGAHYQAISLDEYKAWAKRQAASVSEQIENLEHVLRSEKNESPTLHSDIRYFEGVDGVQNLYADSWRDNDEKVIYAITDYEKAYATLGRFFKEEYFVDRVAHDVHVKSLLPKSSIGQSDAKKAKTLLRDMRFLDIFKDLGIEVNIYGEKVSIVAFDKRKPSGVIIKNKIISQAFKALFNHMWSAAKK